MVGEGDVMRCLDNKVQFRRVDIIYFILKIIVFVLIGFRIFSTVSYFFFHSIGRHLSLYSIYCISGLPAFMLSLDKTTNAVCGGLIILTTSFISIILYPITYISGLISIKTNRFDCVALSVLGILGIIDCIYIFISLHDSFYIDKLIVCIISIVTLVILSSLVFINIKFMQKKRGSMCSSNLSE